MEVSESQTQTGRDEDELQDENGLELVQEKEEGNEGVSTGKWGNERAEYGEKGTGREMGGGGGNIQWSEY